MDSLTEADIHCPYCGEPITVVIDCSAGRQRYTEDCQVCCSPMVIEVDTGPGGIEYLEVTPENA